MNIHELRTAIIKILDYNWADEERDYNERGGEDNEENDNHIYKTLLDLDRFITEDEDY